jgi:hypothetical protein
MKKLQDPGLTRTRAACGRTRDCRTGKIVHNTVRDENIVPGYIDSGE